MLDFTRRARLASADLGRRAGLIGAAAVIGLTGAGFAIAALWTGLARGLGWGPGWASVAIAVLCLIIAAVLAAVARKARHAMPNADDLKREVRARTILASEAAMAGMRRQADRSARTASQKLHGLWDRARHDADMAADRIDAAAARMTGAGGRRPPDERQESQQAASGSGRFSQAGAGAAGFAGQFARLRASPGLALVSAFAVGLALAGAIAGRGDEDDEAG